MDERIADRQPVLLRGEFSPKLRIYMLAYWGMPFVASVIGIPLLPLWLIFGPLWTRRYFASLRCDLTERSVVIARGVLFRREMTIPLDKIQDISIREGPLLAAFGILQLRIETAGQSNAATGKSDADLIGLVNARAVRDRILGQRDALDANDTGPRPVDAQTALLTEIRDVLVRLESRFGA
ncbi:PH domain-containing protein [uncultured Sphingomonas sp.]|uniref:PH domain-containing protein n=1 Tax=uncultured Sphingomonas sp. TaxID=158754 RepID=UPI0026007A48|nr:PH domain-containing protein [uncultured Sphingomonas sp.]